MDGQAPIDRHRTQGGEERRNEKAMNDQPVGQPGGGSKQESQNHDDRRRETEIEEARHGDRDEADHRARGKVDLSADDHEIDPESGNREQCTLAADVESVLPAEIVGVEPAEKRGDRRHGGDQDNQAPLDSDRRTLHLGDCDANGARSSLHGHGSPFLVMVGAASPPDAA